MGAHAAYSPQWVPQDAGATVIEVRIKDHGLESLEVVDNGESARTLRRTGGRSEAECDPRRPAHAPPRGGGG